MPRPISFAATIEQIRNRDKTVTRRDAWEWLDEGTLLKPVEKVMGFDKGESQTLIFDDGTLIRVTDVRREPLEAIENHDKECPECDGTGKRSNPPQHYYPYPCNPCRGQGIRNSETLAEGVPHLTGQGFVEAFCEGMGVDRGDEITRIEFEYVDGGES